jgi:hypothetical protein
VSEDVPYLSQILDDRNDLHFASALGAHHRVDLIDLDKEPRPSGLRYRFANRWTQARLRASTVTSSSRGSKPGSSEAEGSGACDARQPSGARAATWGIWDQRHLVRDEYSPYRVISCTRRGGISCVSSAKNSNASKRRVFSPKHSVYLVWNNTFSPTFCASHKASGLRYHLR